MFIKVLLLFFNLLLFTAANKESINNKHYEVCAGMYSKQDRGGKVDPYISFDLKKLSENGKVTVAIYDFQDFEHLGVELSDGEVYYICDDYTVSLGLCDSDNIGRFIITDEVYDPYSGANRTIANQIMTFSMDSTGMYDNRYPINQTGYYCVTALTGDTDTKFTAEINFRNAYGQLSGSEVNNLPLYGLLAIAYVVAMSLYSFAFWKHKHELLPLQKYILAFYIFLAAETIFVWAYYDIKNEKGDNVGVKIYSVFLSLLTAGKVNFSFFLLLLISLGYGIVYPKLNKTLMRRCQLYALSSFLFSCAFLIQSYMSNPDKPSPLILITFIPTCLFLLIFYFMILRSMTNTIKYLRDQRQVVKLDMYRRLITIIYISLFVLLLGSVVTSIVYLGVDAIHMIEENWKSRFLITDFWPTLVYFFVFVSLSFIWRPTDTSYMLAVSQQLPTDPENVADFDLSDLQSLGSLQDNDDVLPSESQDHISNISDDIQLGHQDNGTGARENGDNGTKGTNGLNLDFSDAELDTPTTGNDDPANKRTIL